MIFQPYKLTKNRRRTVVVLIMKIHIRNLIVHSENLNFRPSQMAQLDAIMAHFKYLWKSLNRPFLAPAFSHTGWAPSCVTCVLGYDIYDCMH